MITFTSDLSGIDSIIELFNENTNIIFIEIGVYSGDASERFLNSNKILKYYAIDPWKNGYDNNDSLSNGGTRE